MKLVIQFRKESWANACDRTRLLTSGRSR